MKFAIWVWVTHAFPVRKMKGIKMETINDVMTLKEVMAWLRVSESTIHLWKRLYGFPHTKVGLVVRFSRREVEAWWEKFSTNTKGKVQK